MSEAKKKFRIKFKLTECKINYAAEKRAVADKSVRAPNLLAIYPLFVPIRRVKDSFFVNSLIGMRSEKVALGLD